MSKLITVFGATGAQGGSVVNTFLTHPVLSKEYKVRAITRDASSRSAKGMIEKGVEVVSADMTSLPSLHSALDGSHTVFLLTYPDFNDPENPIEVTQGKNVTDVCKLLGIKHLIFSSLVNVTEVSNGRLSHVLHFDRKAEIEVYVRASGVPCSFVLPGYFMSNFTTLGMIKRGEDGDFGLAYPVSEGAEFPLIDAGRDLGKFVAAVVIAYSKPEGAQVLAAAGYYTPKRIVTEFSEVTGKVARFVQISDEIYKAFLPPNMAQEMLENHLLIEGPGYYAGKPLEESLMLVEKAGMKLTTLKEFLERNKSTFA